MFIIFFISLSVFSYSSEFSVNIINKMHQMTKSIEILKTKEQASTHQSLSFFEARHNALVEKIRTEPGSFIFNRAIYRSNFRPSQTYPFLYDFINENFKILDSFAPSLSVVLLYDRVYICDKNDRGCYLYKLKIIDVSTI
ncbi:MAG: hypothetical protein HEEMFOPI_01801 [Holosporales bacterium]